MRQCWWSSNYEHVNRSHRSILTEAFGQRARFFFPGRRLSLIAGALADGLHSNWSRCHTSGITQCRARRASRLNVGIVHRVSVTQCRVWFVSRIDIGTMHRVIIYSMVSKVWTASTLRSMASGWVAQVSLVASLLNQHIVSLLTCPLRSVEMARIRFSVFAGDDQLHHLFLLVRSPCCSMTRGGYVARILHANLSHRSDQWEPQLSCDVPLPRSVPSPTLIRVHQVQTKASCDALIDRGNTLFLR